MNRHRIRQLALTLTCCFALTAVYAAEPATENDFNVPSQDVGQALELLATQAGVFLLFPYDLVSDFQSSPLKGRYSVSDALTILLMGTPLSGSLTEGEVIVVSERVDEDLAADKPMSSVKPPATVLAARVPEFSSRAQSHQQQEQLTTTIDEVIVTGSRIGRTNWTSPSQVTVLTKADLQARGVVRIEDLLNTLPQALAARTSSSGIASNTTTVNLRGLGAERTLVLFDGKRTAYGSPTAVATDLNQFPARLVERVEILTGGATAVYGADAIAGVVNIVPKRRFQGVEATFQGSLFSADNNNRSVESTLSAFNQPNPGAVTDGGNVNASVILGRNVFDDRGNITAFANYSKDEAIQWADRDISACPLGLQSPGAAFSCRGSEALPRFTRFTRSEPPGGFDLVVDPESLALRNFEPSTDAFNFARGNYLQRPSERINVGISGNYQPHTRITAFADLSLSRNKTTAQIAPSGLATGRTSSINCDNPLLSPEQLNLFCNASVIFTDPGGVERAPLLIGRRNNEGGPRRSIAESNSYRFVGGLRGQFEGGLNYEVFALVSEVDYDEVLVNEVLTERALLALDVVTHPSTGQPVCRSSLTAGGDNCVPWNVFTPNAVTSEAVQFLTEPSRRSGGTRLRSIAGNVSGKLVDFGVDVPWMRTVQAVVGAEFRDDELLLRADPSSGITLPRQPVSGAVAVAEVFGELQAPLLYSDQGEELMTLHTAYRLSDYDTTGSENTFSLGFTWEPMESVRLRAQYQHASRSPNPIELFSPQAIGRFTLSLGANGLHDPCAGDFDPATSAPEPARTLGACARSGVTAAQYGQILDSSTGEFDTLTGGNSKLRPEASDSITFGLMWSPPMLQSLHLAVDYFSIDVDDFIDTVPPESALTSCLNRGDNFSCELINRDNTGSLWLIDDEAFIRATTINTGRLDTSGIDVSASYSFSVGEEKTVDVRYLATLLHEYVEVSQPGLMPFDCAGYYGGTCATPRPNYRHRLSLNWSFGERLSAFATWRHIKSVRQFATTSSGGSQTLPRNDVFDLSLKVTLGQRFDVRLGVNNVFDQDPPLTTIAGFGGDESTGRANTYPQLYDANGRFLFLSVTGILN